jgi:hypothetical protein
MNGMEETVHYCEDCAPATGFEGLTLEEIMALSVVGKKCEFCGGEAFSGVRGSDNTIYWCHDCGLERGRIISELLAVEHPDWKRRFKETRPPFSTSFHSEFIAWAVVAGQKAVQLLKDRKRQDGRDTLGYF